jgi:two-component system sensor histidine kinase DesK
MVIGAQTLGGGDDREARLVGDAIAGMCERTALAGGSLTYGKGPGGGFRVAALLPAGR